MRRLSQICEVLGSEAALAVVGHLLNAPATQKSLLGKLRAEGIHWKQPRFSTLMTRLGDLGLVIQQSQKAPYELVHPESTAALLHHLAGLGLAIAGPDKEAAEELERLARRARVRPADLAAGSQDAR
jgi:hypothetical protein